MPGSGKSTYLQRLGVNAISSDELRRLIIDDPTDQTIHSRIFAAIRYLIRQRIAVGRPITYVDATHLMRWERRPYVLLARQHGCELEALFFDVPVEVCIYILRKKRYPIRGILDDALLASALEEIPDRQDFSILSPGDHPLGAFDVIGFGDCHDELREEFIRLKGKQVRIGQDHPFDRQTFFERPDEVFVACSYIHPEPRIWKNWTTYPAFEAEPDRYHSYIGFW